jgi:hypothetical protein
MKLASFLLLILTAPMPIIIGLIFIYALPGGPETKIDGFVLPMLPIAVGLFILLLSFLTLRLSNKGTPEQNKNSTLIGWIFIFIGSISQITGLTIAIVSFYSPSAIGLSPNSNIGIIAFIVATCFLCYILVLRRAIKVTYFFTPLQENCLLSTKS